MKGGNHSRRPPDDDRAPPAAVIALSIAIVLGLAWVAVVHFCL